jgi:iron complex transport system ATP-binding protein
MASCATSNWKEGLEMIQIDNLSGGYRNQVVICDVNLHIAKGEFFTILGPNGSGKTTLLRSITGELAPIEGTIAINGKSIKQMSIKERARQIAVLSQDYAMANEFTVREIVSLGRYPFQDGLFAYSSADDEIIIEESMQLTDVFKYAEVPFSQLSGGEKQRVMLAKTFAQQPQILILDEPTNHLDIKHTYELLELLKEWQKLKQVTILAVMHDINLAALYSDRIALLFEGTVRAVGDNTILSNEDTIERVFGVKMKMISHPHIAKPQMMLIPKQNG